MPKKSIPNKDTRTVYEVVEEDEIDQFDLMNLAIQLQNLKSQYASLSEQTDKDDEELTKLYTKAQKNSKTQELLAQRIELVQKEIKANL